MKFSDLVQKLGKGEGNNSLTLNPHCNPTITGVAAIDQAVPGTLSYIESGKFAKFLTNTAATALILPLDDTLQTTALDLGIAWIATSEPRKLFAQTISLFYQPFLPTPGIHPTAIIADSAVVGQDVYLGANVVIQERVKIGDRAYIHPNVVVYPDVEIGHSTILHANCTIHERSRIGAHCVIHSGAVIGAEGFGFVPTSEGWVKMEQSGCTVLEDGVEVGCNSNIDRPAVGETRIGSHTKIDNLVQIGHGCQVGSYCALAAQVGLAGRVTIGNRVMLGGQVGIANEAKIGHGAIATGQTGILHDVPAGEIVSGSPAVPHKLYLKASVITARLPEMYQLLKQIKNKFKFM